MIRRAHVDDIPRLVELGAVMHAESPRFRPHAYDPERCAQSLRMALSHPHGFGVVAIFKGEIVGVLVAIAMPHFACDLLQAVDLALFIDPAARGGAIAARMVREYRRWADGIGAEPSIAPSTGVAPERTGQLLEALGAERTGEIWTWRASPCA